jgi:hypothetical protein
MTTVQARLRFGPATYTVSDSITAGLDGGRLVEFDSGQAGHIKYAVADSAKWLGVTLQPVMPLAAQAAAAATTNPFGDNAFSYVNYPSDAGVAWTGEFPLAFTNTTGAIVTVNPGDAVYCDANGCVKGGTPGAGARKVGIYVGTVVLSLAATTGTGSGYVRLANA